jgi:hypothetical protein
MLVSQYPLPSHSIYYEKKEAMMQKVSHGKTKMDKMVRRRKLPCAHGSCIKGESFVVRCQCQMSMIEKSNEEAKKKQ